MKRPSFQFYPGDWQANSNLRRCSHEEKGIWMDVLCLLHDQEEYGVVRWPMKEIAQAIGCSVAKLKSIADKGVLKGADAGQQCDPLIYTPRSGRKDGAPVTILPAQDGPVWYSSRMMTDEYKSMVRANNAPKVTPNPSPKPPIGEGKDAENNAPKVTPNPSPSHACASRAAPSSSSSSSIKPSINQPANAGVREPEKFAMRIGWQPSAHVADLAKQSGVDITPAAQAEFLAHWLTEPATLRTQAEWDKALLQSAKHSKLREASPMPRKTKLPAPENFAEKDYGTGVNLL